MTPIVDGS